MEQKTRCGAERNFNHRIVDVFTTGVLELPQMISVHITINTFSSVRRSPYPFWRYRVRHVL